VRLDHPQVRRWGSWYRWVTLAMLAGAVLVVVALVERTRQPAPLGVVELTCSEIRWLFAAMVEAPAGRGGAPIALVVATPTPGPRSGQPLPAASRPQQP
jgi:hypothetical protein